MGEIIKTKWSILGMTCVATLAVCVVGFDPWKSSARAQAVQERKNHECDIYSWSGCWECYSEDGFWCGVTLEPPYQPGDCTESLGRDCIRRVQYCGGTDYSCNSSESWPSPPGGFCRQSPPYCFTL